MNNEEGQNQNQSIKQFLIIAIILIVIIVVIGIRTINKIRYSRRNNRKIEYYQNRQINMKDMFHSHKQNDRNTKDLWGTQNRRKRR